MPSINALNFSAGQPIFKEGDAGKDMYIVKEGKIGLLIKDRVLEVVEPSGIFGEMTLIDKGPRTATAIAKTDCVVLAVNETQFRAMIQQTPSFAIMVMRIMCRRLRRMDASELH